MIVPEWIAIFIVCAFLTVVVGMLLVSALVILSGAIELYFRRLKHQYNIVDVTNFAKEYKEWKALKEQGE